MTPLQGIVVEFGPPTVFAVGFFAICWLWGLLRSIFCKPPPMRLPPALELQPPPKPQQQVQRRTPLVWKDPCYAPPPSLHPPPTASPPSAARGIQLPPRDPWAMLPPAPPLSPPKKPWHPAPPLQHWLPPAPLPDVTCSRSIPRREPVPALPAEYLPPSSPDAPPIFFQNVRSAPRAPAQNRLSERYALPTTIYFYVRAATVTKPASGVALPEDVASKVQSATLIQRFEKCGPAAVVELSPATIVGFPSAMRYNRSGAHPLHLVIEVPTHREYARQSPSIEGHHMPIQPFSSRLFVQRPSGEFTNLVLPRIVVPTAARLERVSGLRWERIGHERPAGTELLVDAALSIELATRSVFSAREWHQRFAARLLDLRNDHFVRGAGEDASYYRPVDPIGRGPHGPGSPFRSPGSRGAPAGFVRSPSYSEPLQRARQLQQTPALARDRSPARPATTAQASPPPRAAALGPAPRQLSFGDQDPALES